MKKILAAIDFSNATPAVVLAAADMALAFGSELHLLHVIEPEPSYTAYGFTPDEFPAIHSHHDETRARAQQMLEATAKNAGSSRKINISSHLGDGSPLQVLEEKAMELRADLVVLGSHGHSIVASLLLGSVAEGLVRKALLPTLVIPVGDSAK